MKFSSRKKAPKWEYNLKNSDYLIFLSLLRFLKDNNVYNFFQFVFSSYLTKVTLCADFSLYVLTIKFYICDSLLNKNSRIWNFHLKMQTNVQIIILYKIQRPTINMVRAPLESCIYRIKFLKIDKISIFSVFSPFYKNRSSVPAYFTQYEILSFQQLQTIIFSYYAVHVSSRPKYKCIIKL